MSEPPAEAAPSEAEEIEELGVEPDPNTSPKVPQTAFDSGLSEEGEDGAT